MKHERDETRARVRSARELRMLRVPDQRGSWREFWQFLALDDENCHPRPPKPKPPQQPARLSTTKRDSDTVAPLPDAKNNRICSLNVSIDCPSNSRIYLYLHRIV